MNDVRKFWLKVAVITAMGFGAMHSLVGCVEVGGGGSTSAAVDADTTSTATQPAAASE
jgi:hypothetical protein